MAKAAAASLGELLALSPTSSESWPEGVEVVLKGMHSALATLTHTQTSPVYAGEGGEGVLRTPQYEVVGLRRGNPGARSLGLGIFLKFASINTFNPLPPYYQRGPLSSSSSGRTWPGSSASE